jgi:hypothetical protein
MGKKFKLRYHLQSIINDIISEREGDASELPLRKKIFNYLDELYENEGLKAYNSINIIKENFQSELIKEAMWEMTDEEDYLAPTINKKITQISKEYLKEWINDKITL